MSNVGEVVGPTELADAPVAQLLAWRTAIEGELHSRSYVRTASSIAGEAYGASRRGGLFGLSNTAWRQGG